MQIDPTIIEEQELECSFSFTKREPREEDTIVEDRKIVQNLDQFISKVSPEKKDLTMLLSPDMLSLTMEQSRICMLSAFEDASAIGGPELSPRQDQPFK